MISRQECETRGHGNQQQTAQAQRTSGKSNFLVDSQALSGVQVKVVAMFSHCKSASFSCVVDQASHGATTASSHQQQFEPDSEVGPSRPEQGRKC